MAASVTVVGLGCEIDRLFSGQRPALPIPVPPERSDVRDLYDAVSGSLRSGDHVLVLAGGWLPEAALHRARMVCSLVESDHIAMCVTDLPPLATSVLAALTAALGPYAGSLGALAGALDVIAAELTVLAWAGSVAGLRHPEVSMVDHARSVLPWTAFGIGLQPWSFVTPLSRSGQDSPVERAAHALELIVAPAEQGELDWLVDVVGPALGDVAVREVSPTLHGAQWWGTSRLVEAVGVPTDLERVAHAALPRLVIPCSWCGEPIAVTPCPLCGNDEQGAEGEVQAA